MITTKPEHKVQNGHRKTSFYTQLCCKQILDIHSLKEERAYLAPSVRGFSPSLAGPKAGTLRWKDLVEENRSVHGSWKAQQGTVPERWVRGPGSHRLTLWSPQVPRSVLHYFSEGLPRQASWQFTSLSQLSINNYLNVNGLNSPIKIYKWLNGLNNKKANTQLYTALKTSFHL